MCLYFGSTITLCDENDCIVRHKRACSSKNCRSLLSIMLVPPIQATVSYCLNNYCYEDAVFLAERLHAEGINKRFKAICHKLRLIRTYE